MTKTIFFSHHECCQPAVTSKLLRCWRVYVFMLIVHFSLPLSLLILNAHINKLFTLTALCVNDVCMSTVWNLDSFCKPTSKRAHFSLFKHPVLEGLTRSLSASSWVLRVFQCMLTEQQWQCPSHPSHLQCLLACVLEPCVLSLYIQHLICMYSLHFPITLTKYVTGPKTSVITPSNNFFPSL